MDFEIVNYDDIVDPPTVYDRLLDIITELKKVQVNYPDDIIIIHHTSDAIQCLRNILLPERSNITWFTDKQSVVD